MYKWYQDARVCYAFLSDVTYSRNESIGRIGSDFRGSKWFTRGWTLQELLAPLSVVFFDKNWIELGTKSSLKSLLQGITGIKSEHLFDSETASVAQKMSWAAFRTTTRIEDTAYCLLGIFKVNMPPLYGEGKRAFIRLQLEIVRTSDDASIFASNHYGHATSGLLGDSPYAFEDSGDVEQSSSRGFLSTYAMTNRGLRIEAPFLELSDDADDAVKFLDSLDPGSSSRLTSEGLAVIPLACNLKGEQLAICICHPVKQPADVFDIFRFQDPESMAALYKLVRRRLWSNRTKTSSNTKAIYVRQYESVRPVQEIRRVTMKTNSMQENGFRDYSHNLYEGENPQLKDADGYQINWSGTTLLWTIYEKDSSLVTLFEKNDKSEIIRLQILQHGKRTGFNLSVESGDFHAGDKIDESNLQSWQDNKDRVCVPLPTGGFVSATLRISAHEEPRRAWLLANTVKIPTDWKGDRQRLFMTIVEVAISKQPPTWFARSQT